MAVAESAERPWAFKNLPPLPRLAAQLMRMVSTDEASFAHLSELVRADSAFSAEVLRIANSPLLGCRQQINSIHHALTLIGLGKLKSLVLAVALRDFLSFRLHEPALYRCWRHSMACAWIAEELAGSTTLNKDSAYSAGLLHDVGRLALLAAFPAEYSRVLEISEGYAWDVLSCEEDLFEIDHCRAGEWLVRDWQLPEEFAEVAGAHHRMPANGKMDLVGVVQHSCRLAAACGFPVLKSSEEELQHVVETLPATFASLIGKAEEFKARVSQSVSAVENSLRKGRTS
ncbi:MAG TPA: HDOD domain-containing protein [Bryobacteraceae bacterium]|nr:HDOD domain-containing protein [Bryobacteraceae bacterium]HOQ44414.1 HDOD domain-containing protein [Bryobacteraceae bacterium]HPQ16586.1 HDOD domain-containing protein [Bryobacteraceae bacterium]HPU70733.1 HDOD domain-containing protein [Bryobacteraceae bacterium]